MEKFMKFFAEYESITASYIGGKTDWEQIYNRLSALEKEIDKIKIKDSKNISFYYWIKRNLDNMVLDEKMRIMKILLKRR